MTEIAAQPTSRLESPLVGLEARGGLRLVRQAQGARAGVARHAAGHRDRADRPVGMRQVDVPADTQPDARDDPAAPPSPARCCWPGRTSTIASQRPQHVRSRIGMVFQKPNPFPTMSIYDNVISGLRLSGIKVREGQGRAGRILPAPGRPVGRGPQPALHPRRRALRRPAAAPVHRPVARRLPRRAADGRALLGPRPHLDPPRRGDHRRDLLARSRSSSSPTTCSRPSASRTTAPSSSPPPTNQAASSNQAPPSTSSKTPRTPAPPTTSTAASAA